MLKKIIHISCGLHRLCVLLNINSYLIHSYFTVISIFNFQYYKSAKAIPFCTIIMFSITRKNIRIIDKTSFLYIYSNKMLIDKCTSELYKLLIFPFPDLYVLKIVRSSMGKRELQRNPVGSRGKPDARIASSCLHLSMRSSGAYKYASLKSCSAFKKPAHLVVGDISS